MTHSQKPPTRSVSQTEIDRAVAAILASGALGKSARRADLLRYLVAKEAAGFGPDIKAFTIAVDVFGRDASFDPNTDSIVRSEIGRLREALRLFYAETAPADLTRIEILKGSYRPKISPGAPASTAFGQSLFTRGLPAGIATMLVVTVLAFVLVSVRQQAGPASVSEIGQDNAGTPYAVARIAIAPFTASGSNPNVERLAFGLHSELAMDLSAYPWVSVVSPLGGIENAVSLGVDYALTGEVFWDGDVVKKSTQLLSLPGQSVIWSDVDTVDADVRTIEAEIVEVASNIAAELGALRGIAPDLVKAQNARSSDEGLDAFLCFLDVYRYLEYPSDDLHLHLRRCLTDAVEAHPTFGDGWSALAVIHMDEARFGRNPRPGSDPWQDASQNVEQALKFEPLRMPVLNAALIESIEAPDKDIEAFEAFSQRLISLFPHHTFTLVNVGSRQAEFAGQWDEGQELIDRAIRLHPDPPSSYFVTRAYRTLLEESDDDAVRAVEPLTVETSRSQLLLHYVAAARVGSVTEMRRYRQLLSAQGLATHDDIVKHVQNRRYDATLEAALLSWLSYALEIDPE